MRRYCILFVCLISLLGCKQDEIMFFQSNDAMSIYKGQYEADSTSFSFAYYLPAVTKDTIWVTIRVQGKRSAEDRIVEMKAVEGTTALLGTDFVLPEFVFKAGSDTARYPVVLLRNESLKSTTKTIKLSVKPNSYFERGALGQEIGKTYSIETYTIHFNDYLSKPGYWSALENYVGAFSVAKFQFMLSVYGAEFDFAALSTAERLNLRLRLRTALVDYEAKNGPLYDENNQRVTF
ncbi:DUF4843 domain-containing protein [Sphingobacterium yanglingense]|uniref:Uncharacterized protein DUF4843 n=1 Tax=Sphingobacterium yanglingense TaxID=1437280 RepID=A0A4R6WKH0_9SPHI|nr:DUF4843 domain-containing protein [Sphingobacterium yanglingense]TDQ79212.1 uncharacterized protein DUF4843 [Sphingobacterium yanglingense]